MSLALTRLPKTLNEIYDRIISQIEEEYYDDAYRLLHWLIYAKRRMRLKELAEVLTINLEGDEPHFDVGNRLYRARSVLTICSSLISISGSEIIGHEEISLAHFSVKEFLESNAFTKHVDFTKAVDDPYRRGPRLWYSSPEELSVKSCLAYLIAIKDTRQERAEIIASFPLADYAAEFWARHAFDLHSCDPGLWRFAMQLLIRESDAFVNWVYIYDIEKPWLHHRRDAANGIKCDPRPLSPLYLCCLAGLPNLVNLLLNRGDDPNEIGGIFGTPLHAACFVGCAPIVSALLNRKASPNRASGLMRFPLLAAAYQGHSGAVFALLKNNANIEVGDEVLGNALLLAAKGGHEEVVRLLVSRGLAVDQMIARCDSPLQGAIRVGHFGIVQYLVSEGAQVLPYIVKTATTDCPSEEVRKFILQHERPFPDHRRASERQYREKDVTQLVSELGIKQPTTWSLSDLNCIFDSDRYTESSPLIAAAGQDNNQLLSDLLDQGININKKLEICLTERHPISLTALLLAASNGHEKAVTLLLRRNANPNVTAGVSPLQLAVYRGHLSIVRLLLGHSQPADVDYKGGPLGSALQAAVLLRDVEVFTEILGRTACVCGTAGLYANPLNAAVSIGSQEAVKLLLGFVPYPRPWKGRLTPCRIPMHCRFSTDQKIVALKTAMKLDLPNTLYLISKDLITTPNDSYILVENCLCLCRVAVELGNLIQLDVVLEQIKTFGEEDAYQNTLKGLFNVLFGQPENVDMIQYLLDHGADPNTRVERGFHSYDYECVLHFAVRQGRLATAKLLLDCGANPRGTGYGGSIKKLYANNWTMLHEAAVKGGRDFVQLLLKSDSGLLFERTAEKGRLPVHVACEYGNIDSFEEMIAHGVDINATDNTNATLMHVAVDFLRVELVKVLLQKGASTTARNENGLTPLELAMTKNRLGFYDAMVDADKKEEIIRLLSVLESSS